MKKIHCISGLGADERVFKNLKIKGAELKHLSWQPFEKGETMESYAAKMFLQVEESRPIILGLSFGGMLATEIAKKQDVKKTILISSAKAKGELPDLSSIILFILKAGLIPYPLLKTPNKFLFERFGATTEEEKKLLSAILKDTDIGYLKESIKVILGWENEVIPENILHIHGTHDRIIQPDSIQPNYWITGGTHMMVWNRAAEIAQLIEQELKH